MFRKRDEKSGLVEVTLREHDEAAEKYKLALSSIDDSIQGVRNSREKIRRIFFDDPVGAFKKV